MIVQGTNVPLEITFDRNVSTVPVLVVTIWNQARTLLKKWEKEDMTIDGAVVTLPLTEEETADWPTKQVVLEAKGLNEEEQTIFWDKAIVPVGCRYDRSIRLVESEESGGE